MSATATSNPSHTVLDTITLNDTERELFTTLLSAAQHAGSRTVLRCAGGWVRDKLLGKTSLDIDIALDDCSGKDFAERVNEYLRSQGKETRSAAVIQSNPDQSKHLETARMKISDLWIDLVNLRSETYAQDSRIPTMEFGTAEQDALRRDFTINSMFYNINAGAVEDLTGRGMDDLRAGIIRTPLPPMETFLDDPLRVLRAVRFATRFGFELEASILGAAASNQVREALGSKVSKERVGAELEGMFNGPAPVEAVRLLDRLSLFPVVFALPTEVQQRLGAAYGAACTTVMAAAEAQIKAQSFELDKEERRFLLLAALLLPLRRCAVSGPKGKPTPASGHIVRESIKWRGKDADMAALLHEVAAELHQTHAKLVAGSSAGAGDDVKVALGSSIRKLKQHWRLGVLLAPLLSMQAASPIGGPPDATREAPTSPSAASEAAAGGDLCEAALQRHREAAACLLAAAEAFGLSECWQWKPLLDGKALLPLLGLSKPGPELGRATAAVVEWQLVHPTGTQQECEENIRTTFGKGA